MIIMLTTMAMMIREYLIFRILYHETLVCSKDENVYACGWLDDLVGVGTDAASTNFLIRVRNVIDIKSSIKFGRALRLVGKTSMTAKFLFCLFISLFYFLRLQSTSSQLSGLYNQYLGLFQERLEYFE